jgi:hypothetical protein
MLLTVEDLKRNFSIKDYRSLNFKYNGYLRPLLNKERVEPVVQAQDIVIDFILLHYFQSYLNIVILK